MKRKNPLLNWSVSFCSLVFWCLSECFGTFLVHVRKVLGNQREQQFHYKQKLISFQVQRSNQFHNASPDNWFFDIDIYQCQKVSLKNYYNEVKILFFDLVRLRDWYLWRQISWTWMKSGVSGITKELSHSCISLKWQHIPTIYIWPRRESLFCGMKE